MTSLTKSRKAMIVVTSAVLISLASLTGCGVAYTGVATVQSHKESGKNCRAVVLTEEGETKEVTLGTRPHCAEIVDGQKVTFENGFYIR